MRYFLLQYARQESKLPYLIKWIHSSLANLKAPSSSFFRVLSSSYWGLQGPSIHWLLLMWLKIWFPFICQNAEFPPWEIKNSAKYGIRMMWNQCLRAASSVTFWSYLLGLCSCWLAPMHASPTSFIVSGGAMALPDLPLADHEETYWSFGTESWCIRR